MSPLIYSNIGYTFGFLGLFLAWSISELLGPARWRGTGERTQRDRGSIAVLAISAALGVILYFLAPVLFPAAALPWSHPLLFFLGIGLVVVGTIWRWWAIGTLGRYFTGSVVIHTNQPLVRHGPYRWIRHPAYAGILLVVIGFGVMMAHWVSLVAITLGMLIGLLYRMAVEERALREAIGQPYVEYMQTTRRLIPFLF